RGHHHGNREADELEAETGRDGMVRRASVGYFRARRYRRRWHGLHARESRDIRHDRAHWLGLDGADAEKGHEFLEARRFSERQSPRDHQRLLVHRILQEGALADRYPEAVPDDGRRDPRSAGW